MRFAFLPSQIESDGRLKNTAINLADLRRADDAKRPERGLSVFRQSHAPRALLAEEAVKMHAVAPEARREVWGFEVETAALRGLIHGDDGERSVCVVDATVDNIPSHAECWGAKKRSDGALRKIRDQIIGVMRPGQKLAPEPDPEQVPAPGFPAVGALPG